MLIPTACRVFENALRLPLAPPHVKQDFRPSPRSQIDELASLRRFVPTGESGEASTHAQSVGCFGYRWLALPKFLALSTQPFELGPGAIPLASGVKRLFAARSLLPYSNLRRCRSLARLHLRSQQPAAFQLSLFATGPCSIGTLGLAARQNKSFDLVFSDGTADPNQCFRLPPSFEDFRFETQARAIQDISRSRDREFTLFRNCRKRNTSGNCGFPVQNKDLLWTWVEKQLPHCNLHIQRCETILQKLVSCTGQCAQNARS